MHKESSENAVKDVCAELERNVQRSRGKTVGGWLRQRKKKLQVDKNKKDKKGGV